MTNGRSAPGYTLMEVIIGLAIVGLIMGFIFEGVFGAARLTTRLGDRAALLERDALAGNWLRETLAAALPAQQRDPPALVGQAQALTFRGAYALHDRPGAPRTISWRLKDAAPGTVLTYASDDVEWTVARTAQTGARFVYFDDEGAWRDGWTAHEPPRMVALIGFWRYPILATPRARLAAEQPDVPNFEGPPQ